jgi:hypothetical protein
MQCKGLTTGKKTKDALKVLCPLEMQHKALLGPSLLMIGFSNVNTR